MTSRYRWPRIKPQTRVYGVIGDPIAHSLSPALHNAWFDEHGIDAVYVPVLVHRDAEGLQRFLNGCAERSWMDMGGFSVTAPHKEELVQWAGDRADRLSQSLGAANTVIWSEGGVRVYNTDAHAAVDALCAAMKIDRDALHGLSVDVLGAGGTGRALALTLGELGCRVAVYDRKPERSAQVARRAGGSAHAWGEIPQSRGEILISTAPPGACDEIEHWPSALRGRRLVFDVNYRPARSTLLQDAEKLGVPTMNGGDMFVRQAAMQFTLWTGIEPELECGRRLVFEALARDGSTTA